jgi:hypothetical protein
LSTCPPEPRAISEEIDFSISNGLHSCSFEDLEDVLKEYMEISLESKKSEEGICFDPLRRMLMAHLSNPDKRKARAAPAAPLFLFWYAMPLLRAREGREGAGPVRLPAINHAREMEYLAEMLARTSIRFERVLAEVPAMLELASREPEFLHFSGHGESQARRKEDCLLFEDEVGMAQEVGITKIKKFLETLKSPIKFIFVASCHSKGIGEVFLRAGAHHVVCVRREESILDDACLTFVRTFYRSCIMEEKTICESYENAKRQVSIMNFPPGEEHKFVLLKAQGEEHACCRLHHAGPGQLVDITRRAKFQCLPPKIEHFVGRVEDKQALVQAIMTDRFVTVRGVPGIGKSTLAREAGLFLLERQRFADGVIFLNLEGVDTVHFLVSCLVAKIRLAEIESPLEQVLEVLQPCRALLIFDNCDALISQEGELAKFESFLGELLHRCQWCKTLFTARTNVSQARTLELGGCTERIILLGKMSLEDSYDLFFRKSRALQNPEVEDLYSDSGHAGPLHRHPLFTDLLNGHPQAVILAAALLSSNSLKNLYRLLLSEPLTQLSESGNLSQEQRESYHSFVLSLELTYRLISAKDKDAVRMFGLMGMMPAGVSVEFLESVFPVRYRAKLGLLVRHSLVHRTPRDD